MSPNSRRRGDDLQEAIYQAAYSLLESDGLSAVTFAKVAQLANTSRSVLYRYWDSPLDLLLEMLRARALAQPNSLNQRQFDQGNLRANLIYVGQKFIEQTSTGPNYYLRLLFEAQVGHSQIPYEIFKTGNQHNLAVLDYVLELAIASHEITVLPPITTKLALFQLIRYNFLVGHPQPDSDLIPEIVDQVVLPAITSFSEK